MRTSVVAVLLPGGLLVVLGALALGVGKYPLAPGEVAAVLWAGIAGTTAGVPETARTVILEIRLPRIVAAALLGAALAAAGATYQSLFRNPLVSPGILGVSSGAGLGAAIAIVLSLPLVGIQVLAFVFGLGAVAIVYAIASAVRRHDPILVLVLAGVIVGTLAGSCISLLQYLADPYDQLPAITFWLFGSLAKVTAGDLLPALPPVLLGLVAVTLLRWRVNVMALGDEEARALGVNTRRMRLVLIAAATLMTAAGVAISGIVGWVGLVIPHVARLLVGPDFSRVLPAAVLLGAGYLLVVDTLARTVANIEIPLGILTAFLGAPFFLWLLARGRRGWQ